MLKEILIEKCNYCPFFRYDEMTCSGYCSKNEYDNDERLLVEKFDFESAIKPPEWCPLRIDGYMIRLSPKLVE